MATISSVAVNDQDKYKMSLWLGKHVNINSPEFLQEAGHTGTFLPSGQPGNWNSEPRRDNQAHIINLDDYFKHC